jgi:drug/metabolite transporter (DMT)-like permease
MQTLAVVLVLFSALLHATWNLLAKRSADPLAFMFAFTIASIVLFAVPVAIVAVRDPVPASGWPFIALTGVIHVGYFAALASAYRRGALSLTYPVSRGTGVLIVPLLAVAIFDERPSLVGALGIGAILVGLGVIGFASLRTDPAGRAGLGYALLTGLTIAAYSLIDKAGVARVNPVIYVYCIFLFTALALAPYVLTQRRRAVLAEWRYNRWAVLAGGVLPPATYVIVLSALRLADVSYVVPLRETSIIFGTLLGALVLGERIGRVRVAASAVIGVGAVAIALAG